MQNGYFSLAKPKPKYSFTYPQLECANIFLHGTLEEIEKVWRRNGCKLIHLGRKFALGCWDRPTMALKSSLKD